MSRAHTVLAERGRWPSTPHRAHLLPLPQQQEMGASLSREIGLWAQEHACTAEEGGDAVLRTGRGVTGRSFRSLFCSHTKCWWPTASFPGNCYLMSLTILTKDPQVRKARFSQGHSRLAAWDDLPLGKPLPSSQNFQSAPPCPTPWKDPCGENALTPPTQLAAPPPPSLLALALQLEPSLSSI